MTIEDLIPPLAQWLGVDPATALLLLGVVVAVANALGAVIPDDATGFLRYVRLVSKFIGLRLSNRVSGSVRVEDVAALVLAERGVPVDLTKIGRAVTRVAETTVEKVDDAQEEPEPKPAPLFPGYYNRTESPLIVGLLILMLLLSGCATIPTTPCGKAALARQAALETIKMIDRVCPVNQVIPGVTPEGPSQ